MSLYYVILNSRCIFIKPSYVQDRSSCRVDCHQCKNQMLPIYYLTFPISLQVSILRGAISDPLRMFNIGQTERRTADIVSL